MALFFVTMLLFVVPMLELLIPLSQDFLKFRAGKVREPSRRLANQLSCTVSSDQSLTYAGVPEQRCPLSRGCCLSGGYLIDTYTSGQDVTCRNNWAVGNLPANVLVVNSSTCLCYAFCACPTGSYYPAGSATCRGEFSDGSSSEGGGGGSPGGGIGGAIVGLVLEILTAVYVWSTIKDVQPLTDPWPNLNEAQGKSSQDFGTGLCDCCGGGLLDCCIGFHCPFVLAARTAHQANNMSYIVAVLALHFGYLLLNVLAGGGHIFMLVMFTTWRMSIRKKSYLVEKGCCHDFCTVCWCTCCALLQESRQVQGALQLRGDPKTGNKLVGQAIGVTPVEPFQVQVQAQGAQPAMKEAWKK